jgi:excisionase family DNA binding protein
MNNPFETIEARLSNIETLLLDIKHQPKWVESEKFHEKLLSIQEAAEFLNLTVPTIYSKVSKSELPVMKRSKRLYFSTAELTAYLKAGRKKTLAEIAEGADDFLIKKKGHHHEK